MKFRSILLISVVILGLSGIGFVTDNAKAASLDSNQTREPALSEHELKTIKANQLKMGSDEKTADQLIEKYKKGELADADLMNLEDAVRSNTTVEGDTTTTTYEFPDGSRAQMQITELKLLGRITPFGSISEGRCQTTTVGTECKSVKVSNSTPFYGMSYYVNYYLNRFGNDSITWVGNFNVWTVTGSYANPSLRILKPVNTSWDDEARLSAQFNMIFEIGSFNRSLSFYVGNNRTGWGWNSYY
ncbi:hypothetical protein ACQKNX_01975 [Lysinibacillus sp. NPDC093712]|uniref:hypothetical protein n=1 Tax=Lysinibacillus sp. NPDC093712 TaxID=3390579 RepID=UPI003CFFACAF